MKEVFQEPERHWLWELIKLSCWKWSPPSFRILNIAMTVDKIGASVEQAGALLFMNLN